MNWLEAMKMKTLMKLKSKLIAMAVHYLLWEGTAYCCTFEQELPLSPTTLLLLLSSLLLLQGFQKRQKIASSFGHLLNWD